VLAAMLAMPIQAQVDWSGISLKTGQGACPEDVMESNTSFLSITQGSSRTAVNLGITSLSRGYTTLAMGSSFPIDLYVYDKDNNNVGNAYFGTAGDTAIANQTQTISSLTLGERYSAHVLTTDNTEIMVYCFRMPPDLDYVENLGTGAVGATGCFAIGGERLGGGDAAIWACFCGARNRLGQWARTGTDGHEPH